jgi:hypothetical protein
VDQLLGDRDLFLDVDFCLLMSMCFRLASWVTFCNLPRRERHCFLAISSARAIS